MNHTPEKTVNIHHAKTHLSRLVDEVAEGTELILAKAGKPVARLVPLEPRERAKKLGLLRGKIDIPEDFDAPLSAKELRLFES